ncbi:MAG: CotH kinase family protein, partial [Bacteroidales bacterium]|nr:CotH kinase family protein [Bacteroidales bacterium]
QDPQEPENPEQPEEPDLTEHKLTGTVIGTEQAVDYDTGAVSYTVNTRDNVFDGDFNTYFASYARSRTWVGLDLGEKHVISKVGYSPRITQEGRVELALLEGANSPDFIDALPLAIIKERGSSNVMHYVDVQCTRGFRYVRYVGPNDARCNLAELEFYGVKGEGDDSHLCQLTNLPTVVINTKNAKDITSKTEYVSSNFYIISEDGTKLLSTSETGIRGRGNASWGFPKKPYKIKFAEKHHVLGSPANDKKWTLINNYGDKTLMRNILAFEVSRRIGMAYTPFCTPVDVILNGEYQGCYQLCDQVEAGKGRVDAKDGYFIEIDAYAYSEAVYFYSAKGIPVTVKNPDDDEITPEQLAFIKDYFGRMETAVFSSNYRDESTGFRKYIDLDSFLKNFIVGEFCGNTDTYWSVNMYKDAAEGVLFTGPVWDYDLAFENDNRTYPINNLKDFIYASNGSVAADAVRSMVTRIVKNDTKAHERLIEIWDEVKPSLLGLNDYVDETAALLDESQRLNFKRWPILSTYVHQNPQVKGTYAGEVGVVKDYITKRLTRFEELLKK